MNFDCGLLLALATAHLLADFVLQSDKDVANKQRMVVQLKHVAIVASLSYFLVGDWRAWPVPALIGFTHFVIELAPRIYHTGCTYGADKITRNRNYHRYRQRLALLTNCKRRCPTPAVSC